jgi:hypothetical protein
LSAPLPPGRSSRPTTLAARGCASSPGGHGLLGRLCFGASNSRAQSAAGHDLAGRIGFYGAPCVTDLLPLMRSPRLMLAGGADFTPVDLVEAFAEQARGERVTVD